MSCLPLDFAQFAADGLEQFEHSPAFVLDLARVQQNLQVLQPLRTATGCKLLYSVKALPWMPLLESLQSQVDGFSVSSLFEVRLAAEVLAGKGSLHLTTPGLREDEFAELAALCSHISFNSLSQQRRLHQQGAAYSQGLRVNPEISFADDVRYDPCRPHSKLGVSLSELMADWPADVSGLHLHTVFGRTDFRPLQQTIAKLEPLLKQRPLQWLNLGGGYLYQRIADLTPLEELVNGLQQVSGAEVFLEPGKALVGNAGFLLTTVLDRFCSGGKTLLILDTSVNHHPQIFEYQLKPTLVNEDINGGETAILAGCSCLAGDLFGEYRFNKVPEVGERLLFADVGAYSLIKASRFNGYPLPAFYLAGDGYIKCLKVDRYSDYRQQWQIG